MADARAALDELRGDSTVSTGRLTVATYLASWLADVVKISLEESTYESYKLAVDNHIAKRIGHVTLKKLRPLDVQGWLSSMARDEVGGRTRANAFTVLRTALQHAIDLELIAKSPCGRISKPVHEAEEINPFTLEEAKDLLAVTTGQRVHAMLQLAVTTGMRQGEIFGLRWDRIDWKKRTVTVDQQVACVSGKTSLKKPKTKASIRVIGLTEDCLNALRSHRVIMMKEGNAGSDLAFPAKEGGLIGRSSFRTRVWNPLLKRCLIVARGFHHLRHTYATLALGSGVSPAVVSEVLGHAKVSTTMDIYAHCLQSHKIEATETIARLFG